MAKILHLWNYVSRPIHMKKEIFAIEHNNKFKTETNYLFWKLSLA